MCVLAFWLPRDTDGPLIVAANRDEFRARPSGPLQLLEPGIFGGKDLQSGGTWLGVNRHGLLVAVTNRHQPIRPPDGYSRGLITLEALRCTQLQQVEMLVRQKVQQHRVAGFNLVALKGSEGLCLHFDGRIRPQRIPPGAHVISTNNDLDDPSMPEFGTFQLLTRGSALPTTEDVKGFLSSHEGERPVCKHGTDYGTVSSAIYSREAGRGRFWSSEAQPCSGRWTEFSHSDLTAEG